MIPGASTYVEQQHQLHFPKTANLERNLLNKKQFSLPSAELLWLVASDLSLLCSLWGRVNGVGANREEPKSYNIVVGADVVASPCY